MPKKKSAFTSKHRTIITDKRVLYLIINGDDCHKCKKNRPYNPGNPTPCPHCGEKDFTPF